MTKLKVYTRKGGAIVRGRCGRKTQRRQRRPRLGSYYRKRRTLRAKRYGGNIFFDANRTPAGATIAGPGNPDLEGGPGTMEEYSDYHKAFEDEEAGPSQGI
jgi:hypothetical protein